MSYNLILNEKSQVTQERLYSEEKKRGIMKQVAGQLKSTGNPR
jgi:hypothetical protein